ncbi:rhodanese-like domain-containing protein [Fluviicola chungangensis]|uniref:Rhodanese-like domain-containing protein n=1 Tax=Fluviicola chungangensis TaxID=2597671 RepID=A0A556N719_9FLAO|nr:rhodanese-like domain-containing protein [Fluviicola chungangensis]TSJ47928.1 rhodanese-like domain-containing protein [Fluviicola chungangensis]
MKAIGIIAGACLLLYIGYRTYRFLNLDKGLAKKIEQGAIVLDVRTPAEYRTGHLKGSVNLQLSRLHTAKLPLDKSKTYITVCSHGLRSVKAMNLLKEKGYKVFNGGALADLENEIKQ